jgi:hypothetical protein
MSVWIVKINALDASNNPVTLHFGDEGIVLDGIFYEQRMLQPALIKISPNDGGVLDIFADPSVGEIELINIDGELNYLCDYALDNSSCVLSLVSDDGTIIDYLSVRADAPHEESGSIFIPIRSMSEVLQRTHPNTKYAGSNVLPAGIEGVATDIKGSVKPRVFGKVANASPVLVNTSYRLIYQFSDRQTCIVNAVYDKGLALTLGVTYTWDNFATFQTDTVAAGQFIRCCGYIRLGAAPVGTVTGDASDSAILAGDVFDAILSELTPAISFDSTSKATLNAVGQVGLYVTSETSTAELLNKIISSCGAHWFFIADVMHAHLTRLATVSSFEVTDSEITENGISRSGIGLGKNGIPYTSCLIKYGKIETVQQETELASTVTASRKSLLARDYRSAYVKDDAVLARHPLASAIEIESVLVNEADAIAVATRLLNLSASRCDVVQITAIVHEIPALEIGQGITVSTSSLGYGMGRLMTVISYEVDAKRKEIVLGVIG